MAEGADDQGQGAIPPPRLLLIAGWHHSTQSLKAVAAEWAATQGPSLFFPSLLHAAEGRGRALVKVAAAARFGPRDVVLLWAWSTFSVDDMRDMREGLAQGVTLALYNWDDPHAWTVASNRMAERAALLDVALTCCRGSVARYNAAGASRAAYLVPTFRAEDFEVGGAGAGAGTGAGTAAEGDTDVLFCCTNLYANAAAFPNALVRRYDLLEAVAAHCAARGYTLAVYGPPGQLGVPFLAQHLRGPLPYERNAAAFAAAKVCLNHHVTIGDGYLNERCVTTLASGGVMLVDRQEGLESVLAIGEECAAYGSIPECLSQIDALVVDADARGRMRRAARAAAEGRFGVSNFTRVLAEAARSVVAVAVAVVVVTSSEPGTQL
jgi:hypothetical protein